MDLTEGSISWHRKRRWLDGEISKTRHPSQLQNLDEATAGWVRGFDEGRKVAYLEVRGWLNTAEEREEAAKLRREMFG